MLSCLAHARFARGKRYVPAVLKWICKPNALFLLAQVPVPALPLASHSFPGPGRIAAGGTWIKTVRANPGASSASRLRPLQMLFREERACVFGADPYEARRCSVRNLHRNVLLSWYRCLYRSELSLQADCKSPGIQLHSEQSFENPKFPKPGVCLPGGCQALPQGGEPGAK